VIVAHDLSVLERFCDRIAVMFLGQIMELAPSTRLFTAPSHPYTQALLSAIPIADPTIKHARQILQGEPPDPSNSPVGCKFCARCPIVKPQCFEQQPEFVEVAPGHCVRCFFVRKDDQTSPKERFS
jgi:oligopeptide/dipeptide ABC transporter ATP-binding protein